MFMQFRGLAERASRQHPDLDLIVWPESTFTETNPNWIVDDGLLERAGRAESSEAEVRRERIQSRLAAFQRKRLDLAELVNGADAAGRPLRQIHQIVGVETIDVRHAPPRAFNSALLLDPSGDLQASYYKMHLVMFGEYVPFTWLIPGMAEWSPLGNGVTAGDGPVEFSVDGVRYAPSICFESFVPHLIRRHVLELSREGRPPDALVNITHDGWFWGSSILDLHLSCSVFRAVENRLPMLVAANPGLSAWIDGDGRLVKTLPRRTEDFIVAEVRGDPRWSPYHLWGDLPAGLCVVCCLWWGLASWKNRRNSNLQR
jgi:apolipoprotein N-acyltransferase